LDSRDVGHPLSALADFHEAGGSGRSRQVNDHAQRVAGHGEIHEDSRGAKERVTFARDHLDAIQTPRVALERLVQVHQLRWPFL
jgi:hypothetical protein